MIIIRNIEYNDGRFRPTFPVPHVSCLFLLFANILNEQLMLRFLITKYKFWLDKKYFSIE